MNPKLVTPSFDIIITGVGGQGSVLASRVIAEAALARGWQVRTSETIGMAQREGSVVSHVRIGETLFSSLIPEGSAQVLLSLELGETLKGWNRLNPQGIAIVNQSKIVPPAVSLGMTKYQHEEILSFFSAQGSRVKLLDGTRAAIDAGNYKATNIAMLGALSKLNHLPVTAEDLWQAVTRLLPAKLHPINRQAFENGRAMIDC